MNRAKQNMLRLAGLLPDAWRRRLFQRAFRLTRGLTLGVRAVVWDARERVLLVRHGYEPGWTLPGGGVEFGETASQAMRRELEEETGVVALRAPRLVGIYANHAAFPGDHVLLYALAPGAYERRAWRPNAEITAADFFAWDELPHDITPGARRRIAEVLRAETPSTHW